MSPQDSDQPDQELMDRYRRAGESNLTAPSEAARDAILTEGRRMADKFAQTPTLAAFDTERHAANQPRWQLAAFGSVGVALFALVLMLPYLRETPLPAAASLGVRDRIETAPQATPSAPASQEPAAQAPPQEVIVAAQLRSRKPSSSASNSNGAPARHDAPTAAAQSSADAESAGPMTARSPRPEAQAAPAAPALPALPAISGGAARDEFAKKPADSANSYARRSQLGADAPAPSALLAAVSRGDIERVNQLLDQGSSTQEVDAAGRSPLLLAVTQGRTDMVRLLLARGADPNAADASGQTPLQHARQAARTEIEAMLRAAGAR